MPASPLLTVLTRPRPTVRELLDGETRRLVLPLVALAGVSTTVLRLGAPWVRTAPTADLVWRALVLGPLGSLLWFWVVAGALHWTGGWLGGHGSKRDLRLALAWGTMPLILCLPLALLRCWALAPSPAAPATLQLLASAVGGIGLACHAWSVGLQGQAVAEAQGFRSAWRGLANLALATAVILVPLLVLFVGLWRIFDRAAA